MLKEELLKIIEAVKEESNIKKGLPNSIMICEPDDKVFIDYATDLAFSGEYNVVIELFVTCSPRFIFNFEEEANLNIIKYSDDSLDNYRNKIIIEKAREKGIEI